jgi:glycosyltransferase involved in cell wall biosynthesis
MMMGIPSVGTDVVGIKDLIVHGETGYLAKEGDHKDLAGTVIRMLENPDILSNFSINAKDRARVNFNFIEGIKEYQDFYFAQCSPAVS